MDESMNIRVLHIDDEPDFADMTATFLEREDNRFTVETVTSASEGLDRLGKNDVDCVVSDYDMPGRNGIEFLETVRNEYPDLPFILFTGKGSEEVASEAISAGVTDYLQKEIGPGQYTVLANKILNAVRQYRTHEALIKERSQRTALFENYPEPTVAIEIVDDTPIIRAVNPAFETVFGFDAETAIGRSVNNLIVPEENQPEAQRIDERARSGDPVDQEIRRETVDGYRDFLLRSIPIDDEIDFYGIYEDITERKRRERELKESEHRYRTLVEHFPNGAVALFDEDLRYTLASGRIFDEIELSADDLEGSTLWEAYTADVCEIKEPNYRAALAGESNVFEVAFEDRIHRVHTVPVADTNGTVIAGMTMTQDITERREHERKLTALHNTADDLTTSESVDRVYERTIEASEEILAFDLSAIDIEKNGMLTKAAISENVPVENITDMPAEEGIAGRTYRTGESFVINDTEAHDSAKPQGPYKSAISIPIGDHGVFQAVAEHTEAFDKSDLELAELLISHTQSALNRIEREQELQRQNDRLDEFASVVSHDLRNPLNVAEGHLELARKECASDHLDAVAQAHERMNALVEDLLTLAREGETVREIEAVDFADVAEGSWRNVETGDATLVTETERSIRADRSRFQHLLENLMRNATEHGGENVTVTVGDLGDGFYVEDDGPGIPEDEREQVFEAGYSTLDEGTGFGLNIVREIADTHGWDVRVTDSEAGGARFEVTGVTIADE